jgi:hypothetical protein
VASLSTHTELQTLNLSGTRVTDAGLKSLVGLSKLGELNLSFTSVTEAAVKAFQESVPGCEVKR